MKILIDNCVPLNNGDAALVFALKNILKEKNDVIMSCLNYKEVTRHYPEEKWIPSYINTFFYHKCQRFLLFRWVWKMYIAFSLFLPSNPYHRSDIIISAPGGYIHSYYGIEARLYILFFCKKFLKKKVGIYSQSIGNLNQRDQKIFYKYAKHLDFVFVRDSVSYKRAEKYGLSDNLFLTRDTAFLLASTPKNSIKKTEKKVAISLRNWTHEGREKIVYFQMINELVSDLLAEEFQIEFLSTCQGLEKYVDDSQVAKDFIQQYGYGTEDKITIVEDYLTLDQLQEKIRTYDYIFGTRLHMCILALVNGVMAFNISYEEKGKECYAYLGMAEYTVDYNALTISSALKKFLNMNEPEKKEILRNVQLISTQQKKLLKDLEKMLGQERNEE